MLPLLTVLIVVELSVLVLMLVVDESSVERLVDQSLVVVVMSLVDDES